MCDPEGGCAKRRLNVLQMSKGTAFEVARDAFTALCEDRSWSRVDSRRTCGPLGTFVEHRQAVWLEREDLAKARAETPTLSTLDGIKSTVYGVRFQPGPSPTLECLPFLCYCPGCHAWPRTKCDFAGLCQPLSTHVFQVNRVRGATIAQLKSFLAIMSKSVKRSGTRAELVVKVANALTWDAEPRPLDADGLSQAVTKRMAAFIVAWQAHRDALAAAAEQDQHEQRKAALAAGDGVDVDEKAPEPRALSSSSSSNLAAAARELAPKRPLAPAAPLPPSKRAKTVEAAKTQVANLVENSVISSLWGEGDDLQWCQGRVARVSTRNLYVLYEGDAEEYVLAKSEIAEELHKGEAVILHV